MRSFSRVNDTMASLTGVPLDNAAVETLYTEIRDTLPGNDDLLAFGSAQQVGDPAARRRLLRPGRRRAGHVRQLLRDDELRDRSAARARTIADRVYDKLFGTNLANQPDRAAVSTELVDVMNDLGCTAGCTARHGANRAASHVRCGAIERRGDDQLIRQRGERT